jgi:hypothetical protein
MFFVRGLGQGAKVGDGPAPRHAVILAKEKGKRKKAKAGHASHFCLLPFYFFLAGSDVAGKCRS